jgi:hypothetical protein
MNFKAPEKYGFAEGNFASNLPHTAKTVDNGPDTGNISLDPKRTFAGNPRAGLFLPVRTDDICGRNRQ